MATSTTTTPKVSSTAAKMAPSPPPLLTSATQRSQLQKAAALLAVAAIFGAAGYYSYSYYFYRRRERRTSSMSVSMDGKDSGEAVRWPRTAAQHALADFAARTAEETKVHLFTFPVFHQLSPSLTPYAVRTEAFLRVYKIPYEKHVDGSPAASPNGCVPYITHKGNVVADSYLIMQYLEKEFSLESAAVGGVPAEEKIVDTAVEAAVRALTNYCLLPDFMRSVFYDDRNRKIYRYIVTSLGLMSESNPLAPLMRFIAAKVYGKELRQRDTITDLLLLNKEQYEESFLRDVESVESLLAVSPFIAGNCFTTADAALYSVLLPVMNLFRAERARLQSTGAFTDHHHHHHHHHHQHHLRADDGISDAAKEDYEEALLDAIYINDTLQYIYESEVLNDYVDRISRLAFPDLEEIIKGPGATTAAATNTTTAE